MTLGLSAWLAALIVAAVVMVIGGVLVSAGVRFKEADLAPQRAVATLGDDVKIVKDARSLGRGRS